MTPSAPSDTPADVVLSREPCEHAPEMRRTLALAYRDQDQPVTARLRCHPCRADWSERVAPAGAAPISMDDREDRLRASPRQWWAWAMKQPVGGCG